jgi:hypothetical protein
MFPVMHVLSFYISEDDILPSHPPRKHQILHVSVCCYENLSTSMLMQFSLSDFQNTDVRKDCKAL